MGWDGMGLFMEGWMGDDGVGSSEKQGIRIFISVAFVLFSWAGIFLVGVGFGWLGLAFGRRSSA